MIKKRIDRSYFVVLEWRSSADLIGNDVWQWSPTASYWMEHYYSGLEYDWKFRSAPHTKMLDNCTYRIPIHSGQGKYRFQVIPNTHPGKKIQQEFSINVGAGESVTIDFDAEFTHFTYSVGPTPSFDPECIF